MAGWALSFVCSSQEEKSMGGWMFWSEAKLIIVQDRKFLKIANNPIIH